jgi:hypothetical protein
LRNTRSLPAHIDRPQIFAAVPNLDFSLQRESFGMHSTVQEKLHLLSQPRSRTSAQTLAPKTHRCFMMQLVRGEMAKAQARRDKQESSSEPPHLPLHTRPQWMRDEQPFVSEDEADRDWQEGTRLLFGPAIPPGPSSFTGGNTIKATVEVHPPTHGISQQRVALDTQSDVTTCLREHLSEVRRTLSWRIRFPA